MNALVKEGLLASLPHEKDARSRLYVLTEYGKQRLHDLLPGYYEILQDHMKDTPQSLMNARE